MYIGFRDIRQLEIDNMCQFIDVDASGGNIGGYQYPCLTAFEIQERPLSCILGFVAVNGFGAYTRAGESLSYLIRTMLGTGKHQRGGYRLCFQDMEQQGTFVLPVDKIDGLLYGLCGGRDRCHFYLGGIGQDRRCQLLDLRGHRRGKEQGLPFLRQFGNDLLYIVYESHVQHPVRLVQYEERYVLYIDVPLVHQVQQTAGRSHQDVDAFAERMYLGVLRHTAEDHQVFHTGISAISGKAIPDLDGQLAGRSEDQGLDGTLCPEFCILFDACRILTEELQHGDGKSRGLTCTCLGAAQQVFSVEDDRNSLCLNRGGRGIALFLYSL